MARHQGPALPDPRAPRHRARPGPPPPHRPGPRPAGTVAQAAGHHHHRPTALNDYANEYRTRLNQRTTAQDDPATAAATGRKWWDAHPRTRRAHRRLKHLARQGVLFTRLTHDPALEHTTNPVEAINARIRDNPRHHRGAGPDHQAAIAEWTPRTRTRQPADPQQILTAWHAQGRPPRRRIPTTPTNARTRPAGWGTTPTLEEGLRTRKGRAGRTH